MTEVDLNFMIKECKEYNLYSKEIEKTTICMLKDLFPECKCEYLGQRIRINREYRICEKYSGGD